MAWYDFYKKKKTQVGSPVFKSSEKESAKSFEQKTGITPTIVETSGSAISQVPTRVGGGGGGSSGGGGSVSNGSAQTEQQRQLEQQRLAEERQRQINLKADQIRQQQRLDKTIIIQRSGGVKTGGITYHGGAMVSDTGQTARQLQLALREKYFKDTGKRVGAGRLSGTYKDYSKLKEKKFK